MRGKQAHVLALLNALVRLIVKFILTVPLKHLTWASLVIKLMNIVTSVSGISGRCICVFLGWISRGSDLSVVAGVLVMHLGALAALVGAVASARLLVVVLDLAHSE